MRELASARGEIRLGTIISLAVVALLIYEGFKFGPLLLAQYEFKDAVVEEAKFSGGKTADTIVRSLTRKAAELGLPITAQNIQVTRERTRTRIQVHYQLIVEYLPGKPYTWNVNEDQASVLF